MNKLNLCAEQQEIVMKALRHDFDNPNTHHEDALEIIYTAMQLGLPEDYTAEMFSDLCQDNPQYNEVRLSVLN